MPRLQFLPAVALTLVTAGMGLLSGCGDSAQATYNDADVSFASEMVSHHRQAIAMVDMLDGRDLDPAFVSFADSIRTAQAPEVKEMTGWLAAWDKPTPGPAAGAMKGMDMGGDSAGMMTESEMTSLADTPDDAFESRWLRLMIEHHEGTVQMADAEITGGEHPATIELARAIRTQQTAEIARMRTMLGVAAG